MEQSNAQGVLARYIYTLDIAGNRTAVVEVGGRRVEYSYDALHRLVSESITDPVAGNRTISYTYDAVGNRLSRTDSLEGTTTYEYDANDRLLSTVLAGAETRYAYDNNGNTLSRTSGADQIRFDWDFENRLRGVDLEGDGLEDVRYAYDAEGIRVGQTVAGEETRFLVDAIRPFAQVVQDYSPDGTVQASYTHGIGPIAQDRFGQRTNYLSDGHSGVRNLTGDDGVISAGYDYDGFGRQIDSFGAADNPYQYRGEQVDSQTESYYLRARYYDQESGRFVSTDPFEGIRTEPVTLHRYLYANANPVMASDPSGATTMIEISMAATTVGVLQAALVSGTVLSLGIAIGAISQVQGRFIDWKADNSAFQADIGPVAVGMQTLLLDSGPRTIDEKLGIRICYNDVGYAMYLGGVGAGAPFSATVGDVGLFSPQKLGYKDWVFGGLVAMFQIGISFGPNPIAVNALLAQVGLPVDPVYGVPALGVGANVFTAGFGMGYDASGYLGFDVGVGWLTGISVPLQSGHWEPCP